MALAVMTRKLLEIEGGAVKITSAQRRSNRFVKTRRSPHCTHGDLCGNGYLDGRWVLAWNRRMRRLARRIARGKIAVKKCVPVPCPPFQDVNLEVLDYAW
jgi:hypothetical protein